MLARPLDSSIDNHDTDDGGGDGDDPNVGNNSGHFDETFSWFLACLSSLMFCIVCETLDGDAVMSLLNRRLNLNGPLGRDRGSTLRPPAQLTAPYPFRKTHKPVQRAKKGDKNSLSHNSARDPGNETSILSLRYRIS